MEPNRNYNRSGQGGCRYNQGTTVRYTGQSGSSQMGRVQHAAMPSPATQTYADGGAYGRPVGMAYIPEQQFENLYDAKCGLVEGTMFKDLNLIFCGIRGNA